MATRHDLTLPEEILLLALHDDAGTISFGSVYGFGIAGGIIAELAMRERIRVEKVKKSMIVEVTDPRPTGDPLLDEALEKIRTAKRRASVATWVGRFAGMRTRDRLADRLVQKGILRRDEGRVLLVFSRKMFPTVNPLPEADAVDRMRCAIFDGEEPDVRTAALMGLARPAGLLSSVFDRKALKQKKARIEEISSGTAVSRATGAAVKGAIEAATAAMVAVMAATTVTTT